MEQQIKERPIIFSPPMVRAILNDWKTQTRRIIKESYNGCLTFGGPHPCPNDPIVFKPGEALLHPETDEPYTVDWTDRVEAIFHCSTLDSVARCPYGKPGDRLWVKETFYAWGHWTKITDVETEKSEWHFNDLTLDSGYQYLYLDNPPENVFTKRHGLGYHKRPSIFMPRIASRILLEITDIRAEALRDISAADAAAEGIEFLRTIPGDANTITYYKDYITGKFSRIFTVQESFFSLWDSINGPGSAERNPWVWPISFKRITQS